MNVVKVVLHKLGYTHQSEITEDYLCYELAKYIGDPNEYTIDQKLEEEFFNGLARVNYVNEYFKSMMAKDMQRDFGSADDSRQMIRGAYARTAYLKSRMRRMTEDKAELKIAESKIQKIRFDKLAK